MRAMQAKRMKRATAPSYNAKEVLRRAADLQGQERLDEAEQLYLEVLAHDPRSVMAMQFLALLRTNKGALGSALEHIATAIECSETPEKTLKLSLGTLKELASRFKAKSQHEQALVCYDLILAASNDGTSFRYRCEALLALGRLDEALAGAEEIVRLFPDDLNSHFALGRALEKLGRLEDSLASYSESLRLGETPGCHGNIGVILDVLGQVDDAVSHYDKAIALSSDKATLQMNKGVTLLAAGRFKEGWAEYKGRVFVLKDIRAHSYSRPYWAGEKVDGGLLISGEQGIGDQIIYASMLPEMTEYATSIMLQVDPRLVSLLARSFPEISVSALHQRLPEETVAAQTLIGNPGQYLRQGFEDFPDRDHFLVADRDRTAKLRERLAHDGRRVIGVSWRSKNPDHEKSKSAQITDFAAVFRLPNCRFVDLQYGDTSADRALLQAELGVTLEHFDDIDNKNDIDGLAALISACDAVVSVSNTTVHLAGALGRPTWTFTPFGQASIWYWFLDRNDSPFYKTMQLRRRRRGQSWADLIADSASEIDRLVG